jgi:hypothetical protein
LGSRIGAVLEAQRVLQHRVHLVGDVAHGRRAFPGLLGEQPRDQQLEPRRNRLHRLEARHRLGRDLLGVEGRVERRITRQQFVGQRTEAVDVVGGPGRLAGELLGARGERRSRRTRRAVAFRGARAEVGEQRSAGTVQQYVRRLEVAMHDAARVRVLERGRDVDQHRQDLGVCRATHLAQVTARRQHHGQHRGIGATHRFEHAQYARMIEPRGQREFALEHLPGRLGVRELRIQHLERDVGLAQFIARAPDFAVPAGAEFFDEHEAAAQLGAGLVLVCHVSLRVD